MDRAEQELQGRRAETLAAWYLRLQGYRIVARRVQTIRGEVDLIARRGNLVLFVEVKWRKTIAQLDLAIDARRLRRVIAATEMLAPRYVAEGQDIRIDAILLAPWRFPRHITNVSMSG